MGIVAAGRLLSDGGRVKSTPLSWVCRPWPSDLLYHIRISRVIGHPSEPLYNAVGLNLSLNAFGADGLNLAVATAQKLTGYW